MKIYGWTQYLVGNFFRERTVHCVDIHTSATRAQIEIASYLTIYLLWCLWT